MDYLSGFQHSGEFQFGKLTYWITAQLEGGRFFGAAVTVVPKAWAAVKSDNLYCPVDIEALCNT